MQKQETGYPVSCFFCNLRKKKTGAPPIFPLYKMNCPF